MCRQRERVSPAIQPGWGEGARLASSSPQRGEGGPQGRMRGCAKRPLQRTQRPPHRLTYVRHFSPLGRRGSQASPNTPRNRKGQHQKCNEQQQRQPKQHLRNRRRGRGDPGKSENARDDGDGEEDESPFQLERFPRGWIAEGECGRRGRGSGRDTLAQSGGSRSMFQIGFV